VLAEHGVNSNPANFELYREVVLEVLAANMQQRQQAAEEHARWVAWQQHNVFACSCLKGTYIYAVELHWLSSNAPRYSPSAKRTQSSSTALVSYVAGVRWLIVPVCCCRCCREMLYRLQQLLGTAGPQVRKQDAEDFRRLMWAMHYTALAHQARAGGLLELAAKQLTAALRYVGILPADR
jgi:hypothetical protein